MSPAGFEPTPGAPQRVNQGSILLGNTIPPSHSSDNQIWGICEYCKEKSKTLT